MARIAVFRPSTDFRATRLPQRCTQEIRHLSEHSAGSPKSKKVKSFGFIKIQIRRWKTIGSRRYAKQIRVFSSEHTAAALTNYFPQEKSAVLHAKQERHS